MNSLTRQGLSINLVLASLLLTSCSSPSPFESLSAGDCSDTQQVAVEKHITGQINAISAEDWPKAYTYAAQSFQNSIKLEQFTAIIAAQYQMLINNQGFTFTNCKITSSGVSQGVEVVDSRGNYLLLYKLEIEQLQLGVVAASVIEASEAINT